MRLKLLALAGAIGTGDATFCTQRVARAVRAQGADSLFALKGNRGTGHTQGRPFWTPGTAAGFTDGRGRQGRRVNTGPGRGEERRSVAVAASALPPLGQRWPDGACGVMGERVRRTATRPQRQGPSYLSSLPPQVQVLPRAVRQHGRIETDFQWSLEVRFGDERGRGRHHRAAENLALVRRMALQLLKRDSTGPGGLPIRRLRAGWDTAYLVQVLATGLT